MAKDGPLILSEIRNTVAEIESSSPEPHKFVLSWSHYLILMRVKDANIYATEYALYLPDKNELQKDCNSGFWNLTKKNIYKHYSHSAE